ncbi:large ribosomal subunit protein eL24-like [Styela clava]|uniref:60S ribosomal protein L24-like n=1 Tax=Styela clava TaxID=7725 RepID=UPI00193A5265|nr:60S ribosomal protein L24-like [Styela clava]
MRTELCQFSGLKIYPGHGKRFARLDGKVFNLLNAKCAALLVKKKNPRKISWTVLYRRKHKKGTMEEVVKKRTRRTQKFQRAIQGASWSEILAKRNQKPEVRKAQREQAIRVAKEKKRQSEQTKKSQKPQKSQPKMKTAQKMRKAAPTMFSGKK